MAHEQQIARFLGWFSIGLGIPQLVAPRWFARQIGASGDTTSQRLTLLVGLRELTAGVGLLTQRRPVGWLWSRVVGDMMDLMLLSRIFTAHPSQRHRTAAAMIAVAGIMFVDLRRSLRLSNAQNKTHSGEREREIDEAARSDGHLHQRAHPTDSPAEREVGR